jgi:23S rRNA (uridine2552-2'-O)-methyltransferase
VWRDFSLRLDEAKRDFYRKRAKEEGYRSRAAFKLIQINKKYRLIKIRDRVIDIGSAPGGWLEVASKEVGDDGLVVGVDLVRVKPVGKNVRILMGDIYTAKLSDELHLALGKGNADCVLADLSPKVSGIWEMDQFRQIDLCHKVVDLFPSFLARGGSSVMKAFQGKELDPLYKRLKKSFARVEVSKPNASRSESSEVYLVSMDFSGKVEPRQLEFPEEEPPSESLSDSNESDSSSDRLSVTP